MLQKDCVFFIPTVSSIARGVGTLMFWEGGEFHEAPPWLAPSKKIFLKIEDSRSLEKAISEFYQHLFERSISSLIETYRHLLELWENYTDSVKHLPMVIS